MDHSRGDPGQGKRRSDPRTAPDLETPRAESRPSQPPELEAGSVRLPQGRPRAKPRADRRRRRALHRRLADRGGAPPLRSGRDRPRPDRDRLSRAYVLALSRPHAQLAVSLARREPSLRLPARVPALHPVSLVAAPAQPPPRSHGQPRSPRPGRDLHDDPEGVRGGIAAAPPRLSPVPKSAALAARRDEPRLPVRAPISPARNDTKDPVQRRPDEPRPRGVGARREPPRRVA